MIDASPLQNDSRRAMTFLPINTVIGFSLELYLKTWLANNGQTEDQIRFKFRHKIRLLYNFCAESGLILAPLDALVSKLEVGHGDFSYRYFDSSKEIYKGANNSFAFQVLNELDRMVDNRIGASASMGFAPGH